MEPLRLRPDLWRTELVPWAFVRSRCSQDPCMGDREAAGLLRVWVPVGTAYGLRVPSTESSRVFPITDPTRRFTKATGVPCFVSQ